jgi:two-component system response regulator FixJ
MTNRRVYLIDDDLAVRDSLSFLLSTHDLEVKAFEEAAPFMDELGQLKAGCVLTDMRMPGLTGLQLAKHLKENGSSLPVIIMTGHGDVPLAVEAMKSGVVDFIEKPFSDEVVLAAIESALERLDRDNEHDRERAEVLARIEKLTGRERDVMAGLVAGGANKVIADDLGISARTVEIYRANVMDKMQARSLSDLIRMAIASGLF